MVLLSVLFFVFAPTVLVTTGTSPIPTVAGIVAYSGTVYAMYLLYSGHIAEGVVGALVFLAPFSLHLPLFPAPSRAHGYLLIFDLVLLPTFLLALYWNKDDGLGILNDYFRAMAFLGVLGFVGWSWLSVAFGGGPSRIAMVAWALEQTRYLVVFLTSVFLVRYVGLRSMGLLFVTAIAGQELFAVAQILNGESLEILYYLGSQQGGMIQTIELRGFALNTGLYAGGLVGSSRDLGVLFILSAPCAVYFAALDEWATLPYVGFLVVGGLQLTAADSMSLFGALLVLIAGLIVVVLTEVRHNYSRPALVRASGSTGFIPATVGVVLAYARIADFVKSLVSTNTERNNDFDGSSTTSDRSSTTSDQSKTESPVHRDLSESENWIVEVVDSIPYISANTLPIRITQYDAAARMSADYPLFGIGGYNFKLLSKQYDGYRQLDAIHNTFFAYLAGNGLPGLVFFLASIAAVFGSIVSKLLRKSPNATFALFVGIGMLAFHAASFWTLLYTTPGPGVYFWLIAGCTVGSR